MSFKEWKLWLRQLPLSLKWFVVLILVRPLLDIFYFLKDVSPILSPTYIIGAITPIVILFSFLSRKFPKRFPSYVIDLNFSLWAVIVVLNSFVLLAIRFDFSSLGNSLKFIIPLLLFFYLRSFVSSAKDLQGILQTFIYSAMVPLFFLIYELAINPIRVVELSDGRGGGTRIQGAYADIMNYAIYTTGALLITFYFYFKRLEQRKLKLNYIIKTFSIFGLCFISLTAIRQSSSWGVTAAIVLLFLFFSLKKKRSALVVILLTPLLMYLGYNAFRTNIEPLIKKEYKVIEGEADFERSFNGRATRWTQYFDVFANMPVPCHLFGAPLSGKKDAIIMVGGKMHNDYIRILFLSGFIGLLVYLLFMILISRRVKYMGLSERFLVLGALASILLYSISTIPTLYAPYLYYILPIFAYAALPKTILLKKGEHE